MIVYHLLISAVFSAKMLCWKMAVLTENLSLKKNFKRLDRNLNLFLKVHPSRC